MFRCFSIKEEEDLPLTAETLWEYFETELKQTLSGLEITDLKPEGGTFVFVFYSLTYLYM